MDGGLRITETGGRSATTRHIPPKLALAVGMPSTRAPKGWRWAPLTALARLESGHTPTRKHPEYWGGSISWIGLQDAKAHHGGRIYETLESTNELGIANSSARVLPENTVCLSRTASVGYVVVMGRPMATSQDFVNWICTEELDPDFLKYLFIAEGDDLLRFASGAVHQTIYFPEAKAFHICYPPRHEQRRIVNILEDATDRISVAKSNSERNLQSARALYETKLQALFVRCGEGWAEKRLNDVARDFGRGKSKHRPRNDPKLYGGKYPFVQTGDVRNANQFIRSYTQTYSEYGLSQSKLWPRGTLCITIAANIAETGILDFDACFPDSVIGLLANDEITSNKFLYYLLQSFKSRLKAQGKGSAQDNINLGTFENQTFPFPTWKIQGEIIGILDLVAEETQRLESIQQQRIAALDELKRSLLHQAFSGAL